MYYFDNNATTKLAPEVLEAMQSYLQENFWNPSASYSTARKVKQDIELARTKVAELIGADSEKLIFTCSGSEANSLAILGLYNKNNKLNLVTSQIEHSSVLNIAQFLESKGQNVNYSGVDQDGIIKDEELLGYINQNTNLVSIQWVNSETGVIQDIKSIMQTVKSINPSIITHVDAVQAVGKIPINLTEYPEIDLLSLSAHKFYGSKGVGALFIRNKKLIDPIIFGGKQESGLRGGTENVSAIIGLGKASELCKGLLDKTNEVSRLRDYFEEELIKRYKFIKIHGKNSPRVFNTSFISFGNIENQLLISKLDQKGIYVSGGSACSSGAITPSQVLTAMAVSNDEAWSSARFSFNHYNSKQEIDFLINALGEILDKLLCIFNS